MISYRFLPAAERQLDEAATRYERERDGLGTEFLENVAETIERARRLPHIGTRITSLSQTAEVRRYILGVFPTS